MAARKSGTEVEENFIEFDLGSLRYNDLIKWQRAYGNTQMWCCLRTVHICMKKRRNSTHNVSHEKLRLLYCDNSNFARHFWGRKKSPIMSRYQKYTEIIQTCIGQKIANWVLFGDDLPNLSLSLSWLIKTYSQETIRVTENTAKISIL